MHRHWLSGRVDREPIKRQRDLKQAQSVVALVTINLTHLPFEADDLRMLPKNVVESARSLFDASRLRRPGYQFDYFAAANLGVFGFEI